MQRPCGERLLSGVQGLQGDKCGGDRATERREQKEVSEHGVRGQALQGCRSCWRDLGLPPSGTQNLDSLEAELHDRTW